MKPGSKLVITINDDGTINSNGTKLIGSEKELLEDLLSLAEEVGGDLVVEKHVHNHTHNHHGHDHEHN